TMGTIASTKFLNHYVYRAEHNWRAIGKSIGSLFDMQDNVKIAIFPSGIIPYYSNSYYIDLYGLNYRRLHQDPNYQQNPRIKIPGHLALANDFVVGKEEVNINIYHPHTLCRNNSGKYVPAENKWTFFPFKRHRTILIPVSNKCYLVGDYIFINSRIEELLSEGTILDYLSNQDSFICPKWLCLR
ncbi:MAG: hypothetical protein LW823_09250, partial [Rickettsiales bacterium]|nr:hypothetical protein [Rickettsiales bacterium]